MTYKLEKVLEKSARNSGVACWRPFHQKEETVTGETWLCQNKMTSDTLQRLESQRSSLKLTFGSISPPLQFPFSPERNLYQWPKSLFQSNFSTLCRPAILYVEEQGPCTTVALTAQSPAGILSAGACMMLTRVGISLICIGPWQASIWASSLKISWAREATTGSGERKHHLLKHTNKHISIFATTILNR